MSERELTEQEKAVQETRDRRKKVSETKSQPGTDASWTDEQPDDTTGETPPQSAKKPSK